SIAPALQLRELLTNALDTINCECWSRGYPLSKLFRLYSKFVVTTFQAFAFHVNRELWNYIFSQTELRSLQIGKEERNGIFLGWQQGFNSLLQRVRRQPIAVS
ncbi:MAG: hypothetical protein DMG67_18155, partial [Acidobacteria bacterium]